MVIRGLHTRDSSVAVGLGFLGCCRMRISGGAHGKMEMW